MTYDPRHGQYRQPETAPYDPRWQQHPYQYQRSDPPKRKSFPMRHKILTFLVLPLIVIAAVVIIAAAASSGAPGSSQLAGLAACKSHHAVSGSQWAQIAKDPGSYRGECITVYGQIIQFDGNTGPGSFRAEAGGRHVKPSFGFADYPTSNTLFDGDAARLRPLVEGDLFTAQVTVAGSTTYDTALGGETSAPVFRVDSIRKTGHLDG